MYVITRSKTRKRANLLGILSIKVHMHPLYPPSLATGCTCTHCTPWLRLCGKNRERIRNSHWGLGSSQSSSCNPNFDTLRFPSAYNGLFRGMALTAVSVFTGNYRRLVFFALHTRPYIHYTELPPAHEERPVVATAAKKP